MALVEKAVVLLLILMALVQVNNAAVYKVGDSAGWTTIGNIDYKQWAAVKNFAVGDVIMFEYNAQFHNVMRVSHALYRSCNASSPLATYTTGNDSITITTRGHHYFFCGVPGHCQAGQKVDINVPRNTSIIAPTPSSALDSPPVPDIANIHPPSPNRAAPPPFNAFKGGFGMLIVLAMAQLVVAPFVSA